MIAFCRERFSVFGCLGTGIGRYRLGLYIIKCDPVCLTMLSPAFSSALIISAGVRDGSLSLISGHEKSNLQ